MPIREIPKERIVEAVAVACRDAACNLPDDVVSALDRALAHEESDYGLYALDKIRRNIGIAHDNQVPLCQDTGLVVVFAEVGQEVHIVGGLLEDAVNEGVARGYTDGFLRKSMVADPLFDRRNTNDNTPAIVHVSLVEGDAIKLTILPKGGGSENMSALCMLKPAQGADGVVDFVVDVLERAGGNPCPPTIVGVGIGGNAEEALLLSKRALRRSTGSAHPDQRYAKLEQEILERVNALGVGPQGFGGTVSALAVHVEKAPTHIAMLPVGVSLNCHVARHKEVVL